MNKRLVESCHSDVDAFLGEIDRSVAQSRDVFHHCDCLHISGRGTEEEEWRKTQEKVSVCLSVIYLNLTPRT